MTFPTTPSQTVGPYFEIGLPFEAGPHAVAPGTPGAIRLFGIVYDGTGKPLPDGLIETWQPDNRGDFADLHAHHGPSQVDGFRGFARCPTDGDGRWEIITVKPGAVRGEVEPDPVPAPHIDVSVFARGLLHRLYFADEVGANAADPLLTTVREARRDTLLAYPTEGGYRFDIRLQGPGETVFFAL